MLLQPLRFCHKCDAWKPPRAHHCRSCDRCVLRMDHHCTPSFSVSLSFHTALNVVSFSGPWIGNCVGHKNHKAFLLFLGVAIAAQAYAFLLELGHLIAFFSSLSVCNMALLALNDIAVANTVIWNRCPLGRALCFRYASFFGPTLLLKPR
jgi:hypothetical protein